MIRTIKSGTLPPKGWQFVAGSKTSIKPISAIEKKVEAKPELREELRSLLTSGLLIGERGEKGDSGRPGKDGKQGKSIIGPKGEKGDPGKDGLGIKAVYENSGNMVVVLDNSRIKKFKLPKGDKGEAGPAGESGRDGNNGLDGVGIDSIESDGLKMIIRLTDGRAEEFDLPRPLPTRTSIGGGGSSGGSGGSTTTPTNEQKTAYFDADGSTTTFEVPEGSFVAGTARVYYRGVRISLFTENAASGQITTSMTIGAPKQDSSSPGNEIVVDYESGAYTAAIKTETFDADGSTTSFSVPSGSFEAGTTKLYYRGARVTQYSEVASTGTITTSFTFGAPKQDAASPGAELILDYE